MRYCAKCGTQILDDAVSCPKCYSQVRNQQSQIQTLSIPTLNTTNKIIPLILTNIIICILIFVAIIVSYFAPIPISDSSIANDNFNVINSVCPEDEYGNHDWAPARCTEPAQCYNCNAYRDGKLGEHSFHTDDGGLCDCTYCGILYEIYMDSLN